MNNKETNFYKRDINKQILNEKEAPLEEDQKYLIKPQYKPKASGNLTALISAGFDDNKQMSIFTSDKGVMYYGANYIYKDKNTKLNAMYRQQDPISSLTEETKTKFEQLINDKVILSKDIDTFTKKLFHFMHVKAFEQWHAKGYNKFNIDNILAKDLSVYATKKEIQEYFNVSQPYVAKNLTPAIYSLRCIEVLEFTTKRRDKGHIITGGNDIKKLFTDFNTSKPAEIRLTYSLEYAKYLFSYGFIQYPIAMFKCNLSSAFDIVEYLYRYYFLTENKRKTFTITRAKILENVKSISSFKDVEERYNQKYKDKIYTPFNNAILYINDTLNDLIQIEPIFTKEEMQEQEQGIHEENKKINKEEWAKRKMKITLLDAPDYGTKQEANRKKHKEK